MGRTSSYTTTNYINDREKAVASGKKDFTGVRSSYDGIHPIVNPALGGLRYSKNAEGQDKRTISVAFDVTGSNITNARIIARDLPKLIGFLETYGIASGGVDLQICATGDVLSDRIPLQLSQYERSGDLIDAVLQNTILEGGGGAQDYESYELAFWALVNQNVIETNYKPVAIIFFDEKMRDVDPRALGKIYGNTAKEDGAPQWTQTPTNIALPTEVIPAKEMCRQLMQKYDVFCIINGGSGYYNNESVLNQWRENFGAERVLKVQSAEDNLAQIAICMAGLTNMPKNTIAQAVLTSGLTTNKTMVLSATGLTSISNNPNVKSF